jgi:hypothetical protein
MGSFESKPEEQQETQEQRLKRSCVPSFPCFLRSFFWGAKNGGLVRALSLLTLNSI